MSARLGPMTHTFQSVETSLGSSSAVTLDEWREWDVLADRLAAPPFLRPGWFSAWHSAYGRGELRLLSARDGGRLIGVLPVDVRERAILSPTNSHTPLYGPVADGPAAEHMLAAELLADRPRRIELAYVDPRTTWYEALRIAVPSHGRANRRSFLTDRLTRPPYASLAGGWEAFEAGLPRKFAKDLRRRWRRLEELGSVTVDVQRTGDGLDEALREFIELEASGWKDAQVTAIASRAASGAFYSAIAHWAAERGWLRLAFLRLDGRAIAVEFDLACCGSLYALKSGFDPTERAIGPGQLLTGACIREAAEEGLATYEFLGTDEQYKMAWTETTHERVRVRSFPRTVAGDLNAIARHHAQPLVRRLKRG